MLDRKLNRDSKRQRLLGDVALFLQKYSRKKQKNHEPNDRTYDRDLEKTLKRMKPDDLDILMRGGHETDE